MNAKDPLHALFWPETIAVIGASREPEAIGHQVVLALKEGGFPKPIFPVNPKAKTIAGLPVWKSLADTPAPVDLALVVVPARHVAGVIDDCIQKRVKAVVVISAGFAEATTDGARLQKEILEKVRSHGIRMVGPNCFGVMNTAKSAPMNASFSPNFPPAGNIAMASQSGGLGLALLGYARRFHLGLTYFVSLGNKADLSSNDLIEYWEKDPKTRVILLYLESFGNPSRFLQIARRVSRQKPIVVLKSGRSNAGTRAASSHTAALASSDATIDALLHQAGALRVETMEQMFHLSHALSAQPLPQGRKVALLTNAGGPAILCTDACEAFGLEVPELSTDLKARLGESLPPSVTPGNPLDLVASAGAEHFGKSIPLLLGSNEIHALIVIYTVIDKTAVTGILDAIRDGIALARAAGEKDKPVLLCWITEEPTVLPLQIGEESVPVYRFPEDAARSLALMAVQDEWRKQPLGNYLSISNNESTRIRKILTGQKGTQWLGPRETFECLTAAGFPMVESAFAKTDADAVREAKRLGFPVVLKLASRTITHKTEVGGVLLDLQDESAVRRAFMTIRENLERARPGESLEAVQVERMAERGVEVFVGMQRDPLFGPVLAFGLGGIHVEVLFDIRFRVAPVTDIDVREMVREIKAYRLLAGFRGHPPADIDAIESLLQRAAWFAQENPQILSFDLNPVLALPRGRGCIVVDARLELVTR